jgi:hypothetical protein
MIGPPSSKKYFDLREQGCDPRADYDPRDPVADDFDSREQGYDPRDPDFDPRDQGYDSRKQVHAPRDSEDDLNDFDPQEQGYDFCEQDCDSYYITEERESDGNEIPIESEFIPSFRKGAKKNCHGPYFPNYTAAALSLFLLTAKLSTKSFNLLVRILSHPEFNKSHVPASYKAAKTLLRGLPCMTIHRRILPTSSIAPKSAPESFFFFFPPKADIFVQV